MDAGGAGDPQARLTRLRRPVRPPRVPVDRIGRHGADLTWKCVFPVALVAPRSRGAVEPGGRIDHRYLGDPADVQAIAGGVAALLEILAQTPLAPLLGAPRDAPRHDDPDGLAAYIRARHAHYWHPGASCPMGPDPAAGAVVDGHARLHGLPTVRLADASIFPAIPRGTTATPTTVVGERVAELMRDA